MFKIIFLISLLLSFNSYAKYSFIIDDLCSKDKILDQSLDEKNLSLGDLIVTLLDNNKIQYQGNKYGISSIGNSSTGDEALIILSNYEMLSFGWCYKIDDAIVENMPHEVWIDQNIKSIHWFYGFARYLKGSWITQCENSKELTMKYFCKNSPAN